MFHMRETFISISKCNECNIPTEHFRAKVYTRKKKIE